LKQFIPYGLSQLVVSTRNEGVPRHPSPIIIDLTKYLFVFFGRYGMGMSLDY